ncbi:hypothetical protein BC940DRAFT_290671 [Gongronella butleri]|nr:hypothetical protein BC940DRAFT_290671 [Gongronella butleri]
MLCTSPGAASHRSRPLARLSRFFHVKRLRSPALGSPGSPAELSTRWPSSSSSSSCGGGRVAVLDVLPTELALLIIAQVDSLATLQQLAQTSRRASRLVAAAFGDWLMTQVDAHASLYYAILLIPHRCDAELIDRLIHRGARLPRHLVQQVIVGYDLDARQKYDDLRVSRVSFSRQLRRLPLDGYQRLVHHGFKLYGKECLSKKDFASLMASQDQEIWRQCIDQAAFLPAPLPVSLSSSNSAYSSFFLFHLDMDTFNGISVVFTFDAEARTALWHGILTHLMAQASHGRLHDVLMQQEPGTLINHARLLPTADPLLMDDRAIFVRVFYDFLSSYPPHFHTKPVMGRFLLYCCRHLQPDFDVEEAINSIIFNAGCERRDIYSHISRFFQLTG